MARTTAVNLFRLRPGVSPEEFAAFSRELDRPTCLGLAEVESFHLHMVDGAPGQGGVDVIEVMTVTDWEAWEHVRDTSARLEPVVARFTELVDPGSVQTYLCRPADDEA